MSDSKYKVTKGLAQISITGEPVWVKSIGEDTAEVIRPIAGQNGIVYSDETLPLEILETRYKGAKRVIEFEDFVQTLRQEAEAKRYQLSPVTTSQLQNALEKVKQSQPAN